MQIPEQTAAEIAIREALARGPTPGPWSAMSRGAYWHEEEADVNDADGEDVVAAEFIKPVGDVFTTRGQMYMRDASYIVACNPEAMTGLLAEIDRLRAALATTKATAPVAADWSNRETKTAVGWVNELLTLAEHHNRALPTWARSAITTIAHGLHQTLTGAEPAAVLRALRAADMALASWENGYAFDSHGPSREAQRLVTEALSGAPVEAIGEPVASDPDVEYIHELIFKLECFIDHATGNKLSKSSWALETLKAAHDEHVNSMVEEALKDNREEEHQGFNTGTPALDDLLQETWWMAKGPNNHDTVMAWAGALEAVVPLLAATPSTSSSQDAPRAGASVAAEPTGGEAS